MGPTDTQNIARLATWVAIAYVLGLLLLALAAALAAGEGVEFLIAIPGVLWITLPVICAAGFVGASSTRIGAILFLLLEVALILSLVSLIVANRGQGALIGLIFFPLVQACAIIPVFLIALTFGWRMRPDFLKD